MLNYKSWTVLSDSFFIAQVGNKLKWWNHFDKLLTLIFSTDAMDATGWTTFNYYQLPGTHKPINKQINDATVGSLP